MTMTPPQNVAMKLSNNTTNILKNFSQINQSILIKQGNKLKTISVMKNIHTEKVAFLRVVELSGGGYFYRET